MKKLITLLFTFLFSSSSFATVWITLSDQSSGKIAVVGASSGYVGDYRTMVPVDNFGIAVVGSWYLGKKQGHLVSLLKDETLSAAEAAREFSRLINRDSHKRRVSLVNARFGHASVPGRGCHDRNYYCGKYEDPEFSITGGGLVSEKVILTAKSVLQEERIRNLPLECRMYHGIRAIFHSGGEFKTINRLAWIVDDLGEDKDNTKHLYFRKGPEENLLSQFASDLRSRGFNCGL